MKYRYYNEDPSKKYPISTLKNEKIWLDAISRIGIVLHKTAKEWKHSKCIWLHKDFGIAKHIETTDTLLVGTLGPIQIEYWIKGGRELNEDFGGRLYECESKPLVTTRLLFFNNKEHRWNAGSALKINDNIGCNITHSLTTYGDIQQTYSFLLAHSSKEIRMIAEIIMDICKEKLQHVNV